MSEFNDRVIQQFRSNGGSVEGFGRSLVLIHSTGARSGVERVNPALSIKVGSDWLVIASAAGAKQNPGWYHNLVARPNISIETGNGTVAVTAHELDGEDYAQAFDRFQRTSAALVKYQEQAGNRRLPIFRLTPRS